MNKDNAIKVETKELIRWYFALDGSLAVRAIVCGVGNSLPTGYECIAWSRDRGGNYRYLCIAKGV